MENKIILHLLMCHNTIQNQSTHMENTLLLYNVTNFFKKRDQKWPIHISVMYNEFSSSSVCCISVTHFLKLSISAHKCLMSKCTSFLFPWLIGIMNTINSADYHHKVSSASEQISHLQVHLMKVSDLVPLVTSLHFLLIWFFWHNCPSFFCALVFSSVLILVWAPCWLA